MRGQAGSVVTMGATRKGKSPSKATSKEEENVSWLLETTLSSKKRNSDIPFSVFMFRIGKILFEEFHGDSAHKNTSEIKQVFHKWLLSIPATVLKQTFIDVKDSFLTLISTTNFEKTNRNMVEPLLEAIFSLCGVFSSFSLASDIFIDQNNHSEEIYLELHALYLNVQKYCSFSNYHQMQQALTAMQMILSHWLLQELQMLELNKDEQQEERTSRFLQLLAHLSGTTGESDGSILIYDAIHSKQIRNNNCHEAISSSSQPKTLKEGLERLIQRCSSSSCVDEQFVYVLSALLNDDSSYPAEIPAREKESISSQKPHTKGQASGRTKSSNRNNTKTEATKEFYIDQIKQIMPHFGEGYIELALECYGWNVDTVLSKLLDDNKTTLHPRLQACNVNLPRWNQQEEASLVISGDEEMKKIQLRYVKAIEDQEEKDAYILERIGGEVCDDGYNDGYDDQYDDIVGAGDVSGPSSMIDDYDVIRRYNTLRRSDEIHEKFWNEIRNENRQRQVNENTDEDGEPVGEEPSEDLEESTSQKKWGPNKSKGGRVIGPDGKYLDKKMKTNVSTTTTGPSSATQKISSAEPLTKIQKRRKNDNKAKISNHHRKERSLKKNSG